MTENTLVKKSKIYNYQVEYDKCSQCSFNGVAINILITN